MLIPVYLLWVIGDKDYCSIRTLSVSLDKFDFERLTRLVDKLVDNSHGLGMVVLQSVPLQHLDGQQVDLQGGETSANAHPGT